MSPEKRSTFAYPVARPFDPPPPAEMASVPRWALPVTAGGIGLFLIAGVALLIYCLGPEETTEDEGQIAGKVAQRSVTESRAQVSSEKPRLDIAAHSQQPREKQRAPNAPHGQLEEKAPPAPKTPAAPLVKPKAPPSAPSFNPDPPKATLEPEKPKSSETPPSVPRPRTPDDNKSFITGLPSLLPNEKAFILGPLDIPRDGKLKFTTQRIVVDTDAKPLRLGITPPQYDDMGQLLDKLGEGYRYTQLQETDLYNLAKLKQFNVLFLTCSSNASDLRIVSTVNRYVEAGGTLYASDLRYDLLSRAFPEAVNSRLALFGQAQDIRAKVTDAGLRRILGDEINLRFDSGGWRPAAFNKRVVTTYLEGPVQTDFGKPIVAPLMVKFKVKKGIVIFTAFHNAVQNSDAQLKLLQYMVFSAVNAQVEAAVNKALLAAGATPRETKNLNISAGQSLVQQTFAHAQTGKLQFAVGFSGKDAKLRLLLTSPAGDKILHEDSGSFLVEVPKAPAGDWHYTVAAVETPYANFPYTLVIGAPK